MLGQPRVGARKLTATRSRNLPKAVSRARQPKPSARAVSLGSAMRRLALETCAPPLGGRRIHPSTARGGRATRKRGDSTLVHRTHLGAYRGFADGGAVRLARFARSWREGEYRARGRRACQGWAWRATAPLVWRRFPSPRFFFTDFFLSRPDGGFLGRQISDLPPVDRQGSVTRRREDEDPLDRRRENE